MRRVKDGEDIKKWREELRLSLRELGDQAGIDRTHLWSIEDGRVQPRKKTLEKIQGALEYFQKKQNQDIGLLLNEEKTIRYLEKPNIAAQYRGQAVSKFIKLLDDAYAESQGSEDRVIAAVLGFMDGLNLYLSSALVQDSKIIGLMAESYYTYIQEIKKDI